MKGGEIVLKRADRNFNAGFCIGREELNSLMNKLSHLHPKEKEYYDSLKFDKRKASYLLGRITAKKAICELVEEENPQSILINWGVFQFPVVKHVLSPNIQVSISHCDDIGVALSFLEEHPLAIDIEKIDPHKIDVIKSQISPSELKLFSSNGSLPLSIVYAAIWTMKEGLSKILRTGLTMDFQMLEIISFDKVDYTYIGTFRHFVQYKAISCYCGDYVCSIILPKNTTADLEPFWNIFKNIVSK